MSFSYFIAPTTASTISGTAEAIGGESCSEKSYTRIASTATIIISSGSFNPIFLPVSNAMMREVSCVDAE